MKLRSLKELKKKDLSGKKVLVRVDFNVPIKTTLNTKGVGQAKITETFRIDVALPTLEYLVKNGATVYIATHFTDPKTPLEPIVNYVSKKLPKGDLIFLPNLRADKGEEKNDLAFAKKLATDMDLYVNEAFSVCHRAHASIVGVPKLLPAYAGLWLEKEVAELSKAFKPKHPFVFLIGGVKFDTKIPLLEKFLDLADTVFVGGALANTLFFKEGYEIGKSVADKHAKGLAEILKHQNILLPIDVVTTGPKGTAIKKPEAVSKSDLIVDIGPKTVKDLATKIAQAKFVLWNGPQGNLEKGFYDGSVGLSKAIAKASAYSIVGGGDTLVVLSKTKNSKQFSFVSTGGGAMLDFLSAGTLPGLEALGFK
jgi:phosphoglycerate kinase